MGGPGAVAEGWVDRFPGETESGPAGGISDLKPCTPAGEEQSLDGASDRLGGGEQDPRHCAVSVPEPDVGHKERAGTAETRGGVASLERDGDIGA